MKILTWNVNGLRAILKKDFKEEIKKIDPDIICLQETKLSSIENEYQLEGYYAYFNNAQKKGYSGTVVYSKIKPNQINTGLGNELFDIEGRTIVVEYDDFVLINSYTPNAQPELKRIEYRLSYDLALKNYMNKFNKTVILCGDLNVAHKPIDLENPKSNEGSAGYSFEERESFSQILKSGFTDIFRHFFPDAIKKYTWWSYKFKARERNVGWRIDYFLINNQDVERVKKIEILNDLQGSDHCPVLLTI